MLPICVSTERVWPKLSSIQGIRANLVYIVSLNMLYLSCKGVRAKNYIHTNNFILFKNLLFNNNNTWILTLPQIQTYVACTQQLIVVFLKKQQGRTQLPETGWASKVAQRYCPMAPSILTKPGWAIVHTAQPSVTLLRVDKEKMGVDNEKALELDNRIFFFMFQPDFNIEI